MHPLGLLILPLMSVLAGLTALLVFTLVRLLKTPKGEQIKRKKHLWQMIGTIALLVIAALGLAIALYFAVTPMYREIPMLEGHYASDVPPDEIIPIEDDYCLALYGYRNDCYYTMGIFHTKEEDGKTLYRHEETLSFRFTSSQNDHNGWWEGNFDEYHHYSQWTPLSEEIYGAAMPKDGDIVPDTSHTAIFTREVTVDGEVYVVYIAVE